MNHHYSPLFTIFNHGFPGLKKRKHGWSPWINISSVSYHWFYGFISIMIMVIFVDTGCNFTMNPNQQWSMVNNLVTTILIIIHHYSPLLTMVPHDFLMVDHHESNQNQQPSPSSNGAASAASRSRFVKLVHKGLDRKLDKGAGWSSNW